MKRLIPVLLLCIVNAPVSAGHARDGVRLEDCLMATRALRAGEFVKVEYLSFTDEGTSAYEIEIRDADGREWEFECSTANGQILEMEQEVGSAKDPLFAGKLKVSEDEARATATRLYPGDIEEVEYEIEANGAASYEFDIVDKYGIEFKVEVDATSGEIVEVQMEKWEIGAEESAGR